MCKYIAKWYMKMLLSARNKEKEKSRICLVKNVIDGNEGNQNRYTHITRIKFILQHSVALVSL